MARVLKKVFYLSFIISLEVWNTCVGRFSEVIIQAVFSFCSLFYPICFALVCPICLEVVVRFIAGICEEVYTGCV